MNEEDTRHHRQETKTKSCLIYRIWKRTIWQQWWCHPLSNSNWSFIDNFLFSN